MKPIVMIWTLASVFALNPRTYSQTLCDTSIAGITVNMSLSSNCRLDLKAEFLTSNYDQDYDYEIIVMDQNNDTLPMPVTGMEIGEQLKVQLTSNACPDLGKAWSFVNIEDKIAPVLNCPDTIIECVDFAFYNPIIDIHDCQNVTLDTLFESIDTLCADSLSSRVIRTYRVTDGSGNSDTCTQEFIIKRIDLNQDIEFPESNITIAWEVLSQFTDDEGNLLDPPQNLPTGSGAILALYPLGVPTASGSPLNGHNFLSCGVRAYHDDWEPTFDGCNLSYWREWTVYEWHCTEELSRSMLQKIKVIDTIPPQFSFAQDTLYFYTGAHDCMIDLPFQDLGMSNPTDACTPDEELEIEIVICDFGNLQSIEDTIVGLGLDTFLIKVDISDRCHMNTAFDSVVVIILDTIPPQPICSGPLTISLPGADGALVSATNFDVSSYDVCSGYQVDARRMENNTFSDSVKFVCTDVGSDVMVVVRFTDDFGYSAICMVAVTVIDSLSFCPPIKTALTGFVKYEDGQPIANNTVKVFGQQNNFELTTDQTGRFEISDLEPEQTLFLLPEKDNDHAEGISTFDIILMQKHILGLDQLDSPYKMIAADVNDNGRINASDLFEMRRLILAETDRFPSSTSYVFLSSDMEFSDPVDPWLEGELFGREITISTGDQEVEFMGVKVGDVDKSLRSSEKRNVEKAQWLYEVVDKGQEVEVVVYSTESSIIGAQSTFTFDPDILSFSDVKSQQIEISEGNFSRRNLHNGLIPMSWNSSSAIELDTNKPLLTLIFDKSLTDGIIQIDLLNKPTKSEIYNSTGPVALSLSAKVPVENNEFKLFTNRPNPWDRSTLIEFRLKEKAMVTIKIFDPSMRKIWESSKVYDKGDNTYELGHEEINRNGLFFYEVSNGSQSQIGKMIKLH